MFTPWWYGAYWPSASNYAILSPVRTGRNDYKLNFSCTLVKRFTLNAQCAILNLSLLFFVIPVDKVYLPLPKPVVSWCIWQKNLTGSKLRGRYHCYHVNDCSSKTLVIKGGVHFLRHCWPFITDLNFANKFGIRNSSETDDSITRYIFKRSTAFSQCFQITVRMSSKVKCFLQYFLPLTEFLNIQSQYLNVNLKT